MHSCNPKFQGIINLLQVSNSTERSPISVFAVHLVELSRATPLLIVHNTPEYTSHNKSRRGNTELDHIITALKDYEDRNEAVFVYPLTAVSPYPTMHEDIVTLTKDKDVTIILIPFHKQLTADGELRDDHHPIRDVHRKLLEKAPCSVGILVDRGLTFHIGSNASSGRRELRVAVIFIGGADDQEALSYAWRMAGTMRVTLTVVRFQLAKDPDVDKVAEGEKTLHWSDDEYINEFRFESVLDKSISYHEKLVQNSEELETTIREQYNSFDLYIVGRGLGVKSPLIKGLKEVGDNPELGAMGEVLVSSKRTAHASVFVVQQSTSGALDATLPHRKRKLVKKDWASPILNPDYDAIVQQKKRG